MISPPSGTLENIQNFLNHTLPIAGVVASNGGRGTGVQMAIQDQLVHFTQGTLNGPDLVHNVDAVLVLLHHPGNPANVPLNAFQPA
jgi:hypothetical protein